MAFNIKSLMQNIRNDHHKTEAEVQVTREERQPDRVYEITNLIISISDRLTRNDRTPPWPLSGSDKVVRYGNEDDRPGYFMAAKAPDTLIFLTFNDNGKGVLVDKLDFYDPASVELNLDKVRDRKLLDDIALRLRQLLDIVQDDFKTAPPEGWSWQVRP